MEREKVDGMGFMTARAEEGQRERERREGGRKERGCDTRPLGRDERVLRVSGVFNAGRVLRFPAVVEAPDASKRGDSISGRAS